MWIKQTLGEQRKLLTASIEPAMLRLAKKCANVWLDTESLDKVLSDNFSFIPYCHLLYTIDKLGKQISSNVENNNIDPSYRGQDLSRRPYSVSLFPKRHFMLSSVYISQTTGRPCISAVHPVIDEQQFWGFIVADFDIRHLPLTSTLSAKRKLTSVPKEFQFPYSFPRRPDSLVDKYLEEILGVINKLMCEHGIFHCTLHYSSSQAMLWYLDEPYQYRIYRLEQMLKPDICVTYSRRPYSSKAVISPKQIKEVLERFRSLRLVDDRIYLRSGSLNIFNGMVGLSFSCEGSQYMPVEVFLKQELSLVPSDN